MQVIAELGSVVLTHLILADKRWTCQEAFYEICPITLAVALPIGGRNAFVISRVFDNVQAFRYRRAALRRAEHCG